MHYANLTEINQDYSNHPSTHWAKTDIDPTLLDLGSGLACTRDFVNYYLKGIYVGVLTTGYVEFIKFDLSWISHLFTSQFAEAQFVGGDLGVQTGSQGIAAHVGENIGVQTGTQGNAVHVGGQTGSKGVVVHGFGDGSSVFTEFKTHVSKSVQTTSESSFGSCEFTSARRFVSS